MTCKSCPTGRYIEDFGHDETKHDSIHSCLTCPKGYEYDDFTGCRVCGFSKYQDQFDVTSVQCNTCPADTYITDDRQEEVAHDTVADCIPCSEGKFTIQRGDRVCDTCVRGKIKKNATCVPCSAGTFQNVSTCVHCPAGFNSDPESTKCRECQSGTYNNVDGAACEPCAENTYYGGKGRNSTCIDCPIGWSSTVGSAKCQACGAGTYGVGCESCIAGQYRTSSMDAALCYECPGGFTQSNQGQASCLPCIPGTFQNISGQSSCHKCPKNTKSERENSTQCDSCGNGAKAEKGSAKCIQCDAGEAGIGSGGACGKCPSGQYRTSSMDPTGCHECPAGFSQSDQGQASCTKCSPGEFNNVSGAAACKSCLKSTYFGGKGRNSSCIDCPLGWLSDVGSAKCQACGAGTFGDGCEKCPLGFARQGDDIDATQCQQCKLGETTTIEGAATCSGCDLGKYGSSRGNCTACQIGQYQDGKGETSCKECGVDTYLSVTGKASNRDCTKCSADRTTGEVTGSTNVSACLCKGDAGDAGQGYYQNDKGKCQACPAGADCSELDGISLENLTTVPGYWRVGPFSVDYSDCKLAFSSSLDPEAKAKERCSGNANRSGTSFDPNDQCKNDGEEAYGGPGCMSCLNEDYTMSKGKCLKCTGGASLSFVILLMCVIMAVFFLIFTVVFLRVRTDADDVFQKMNRLEKKMEKKCCCCGGGKKNKNKNKDEEEEEEKNQKTKEQEEIEKDKQLDATSRLVGDQAINMALMRTTRSTTAASSRSDAHIIFDRIKILYSWMQIFTSLTFTFDIPWPKQLREMSLGLGFINLDFGTMLGDTACSLSLPYLDKMLVQCMFPFMLVATIFLARLPAWFMKKKHRQKQKSTLIKIVGAFALILYPGLCTRLFSSLKSVKVEGLDHLVLAVDYSVEYLGEHHMPYVYLAVTCMVIFVVGIPLSVFFALKSKKKWLYKNENSSEKHCKRHAEVVDEFGALYLQYEPKYWYWEVTVVLQKMLLTGAMTIITPGKLRVLWWLLWWFDVLVAGWYRVVI